MVTTGVIIEHRAQMATSSATVDVHMGSSSLMLHTIIINTPYGQVEYERMGDALNDWPVGMDVTVDIYEDSISIFGWKIFSWWEVVAMW